MSDSGPAESEPRAPRSRVDSIPPSSRWGIVREGLTDFCVVAGALYANTTDPEWPWWATASILAGVAGLHGIFKAAGRSQGATLGIAHLLIPPALVAILRGKGLV